MCRRNKKCRHIQAQQINLVSPQKKYNSILSAEGIGASKCFGHDFNVESFVTFIIGGNDLDSFCTFLPALVDRCADNGI
jgi:hypothetical protein